jgi:hypothetical protein
MILVRTVTSLGEGTYFSPVKAEQLQHALEVASEPVGAASNLETFVWQVLKAIKDKDRMQRQLQQCPESKEQCPQL